MVLEPVPLPIPPPSLLGKIIYHCLPVRRGIIRANLRRALGTELEEADLVRLAQANYAHLARSFAECLRMSWLAAPRRAAMARVEKVEILRSALAGGRGVLALTSHLGNWEIMPDLWSASFPEDSYLFHVLRRPLRSRWLERLLTRRFSANRFGVLSKKGSLFDITRLLGEGRVIVFLMDQHASRRDGVEVEFLGQNARVFKSLALVARRTGAPVLPFSSWREADGTHVLRFEEALRDLPEPRGPDGVRAFTQTCLRVLEKLIRRHPEQWLWMHRLWKPPRPARRPTAARDESGSA